MFTQNFIKQRAVQCSAAVHKLIVSTEKNKRTKNIRNDAENNTVVATADSN